MRTIVLIAVALLGGCATSPTVAELLDADLPDEIEGVVDGERGRTPKTAFYTVQQDFRRCAWPACGGFWISQVNSRLTRCADGTRADACYVTDIDWTVLGISDASIFDARDAANNGGLLVHGFTDGETVAGYGDIDVFRADDAWAAVDSDVAIGDFWAIADNGIVCVTTPCYSIEAQRIGRRRVQELSGLDLSEIKITVENRVALWDAIATGRLIGSGAVVDVEEQTGTGAHLILDQAFLPVQ